MIQGWLNSVCVYGENRCNGKFIRSDPIKTTLTEALADSDAVDRKRQVVFSGKLFELSLSNRVKTSQGSNWRSTRPRFGLVCCTFTEQLLGVCYRLSRLDKWSSVWRMRDQVMQWLRRCSEWLWLTVEVTEVRRKEISEDWALLIGYICTNHYIDFMMRAAFPLHTAS